jgi:NAD(P)H-hydrate epimerase
VIPVLSRAQMRAYDKHAIEACNVPGVVLMENAGRGATDVLAELRPLAGAKVVVVCGAGNNGGDGFVVARHLLARSAQVSVVLAGVSEQVTGDARINHDAYIDLGGPFVELGPGADLAPLREALAAADIAVDALFGTGIDRPITGYLEEVIRVVNESPAHRVALDIPSGLDADSGAPHGACVHAHDTITFGHLKIGLLTPEGARLAGRVHVVDLGVPPVVLSHVGHVAAVIERGTVGGWIEPREANLYKHAAGNVLVLAGSPGKVGAALLVARGALRGGAGLVTIGSWPAVVPVLESRVTEIMTARLDPDRLAASLDEALAHKRAVAIGPGFGLDETTRRAVEHVALGWDGVKIVDADAITAFAGRPEALAGARGTVILTPHSGEIGRLVGKRADEVERDRFGVVRDVVARTGAFVVLKGARTIVATPGGKVFINTTGNPALATAGSGDVLAGIMAALACSMEPEHAACAAVHAHGLAAERWRARTGADRGLLAREIADEIPCILAALAGGRDPLTV